MRPFEQIMIVFMLLLSLLTGFGVAAQTLSSSPTTFSIKWSPDGTQLAIADTDGVRIFDEQTGNIIFNLVGQTAPIYSIAWSPDGTRLASGDSNNTIAIWDTQSGNLITTFNGLLSYATRLAWHPNSTYILSAEGFVFEDEGIRLWDMVTYQEIDNLAAGQILDIGWTIDGSKIFALNAHAGLLVYNGQLPVHNSSDFILGPTSEGVASSAAASPDSQYMAIAFTNGLIYIWDIVNDTQGAVLIGHNDSITGLDWNSAGTHLVSVSTDQTLRVWDVFSGTEIENIPLTSSPYAVDWHPDDSTIAYGGENTGGVNGIIPIVPAPTMTCDLDIVASDTTALINGITAGNNAGTPNSICLENSTYALTAAHNSDWDGSNGLPVIMGDITIVGNGTEPQVSAPADCSNLRTYLNAP